ncbi:MAG TPA: helix-turn-helix transcriptional regulator [Ktedonobacterales bacterium]|nr:helix-turn-helix transcriptional regulator [Ktedonobacterales bacterium]
MAVRVEDERMQGTVETGDDQESWQISWAHLLRTSRQVGGLSLTELSAVTGLSKGYLSKLESGRPAALNPSRATLAALARALPSFRALAHMLDPDIDLVTPALAGAEPQLPPIVRDTAGHPRPSPITLGWRDLEVVLALLTLEKAALRQPITRATLARATSRPSTEVQSVLDGLVRMSVLVCRLPSRRGELPAYERASDFAERTGIVRLGDALVLAGALLGRTSSQPKRASSQYGDAEE